MRWRGTVKAADPFIEVGYSGGVQVSKAGYEKKGGPS
jgi:hypothetical protein